METLTTALRAAADDAPDRLEGPDPTAAAWRRGRRRRTVRRASGTATVLAVLTVLLALVATPLGLPRAAVPAGDPRPGVSSYPQRIGPQMVVRDLPAVAPPLSALLEVSGTDDPLSWQAVTETGVRYRIVAESAPGDFFPALSDDGTVLAALSTSRGPLVVRDLAEGRVVDSPDIGGRTDDPSESRRYALQGQSPGYFSPDDGAVALLLMDGLNPDGGFVGVVDTRTGAVTEVRGMQQAAGWLDDRWLVGRAFGDDPLDDESPVHVVAWDRETGARRTLGEVSLDGMPDPATAGLLGQWWGRVRSDSTLWLTAIGSDRTYVAGVGLPDLGPVGLDGSPRTALEWTSLESAEWEEVRWSGSVPLHRGHDALLATPEGPEVVAYAGIGSVRTVWAQDALDGGSAWTPWGVQTGWWAWWWGAILAAGALVWVWRAWADRRWPDGIRPPGGRGSAATRPSDAGR